MIGVILRDQASKDLSKAIVGEMLWTYVSGLSRVSVLNIRETKCVYSVERIYPHTRCIWNKAAFKAHSPKTEEKHLKRCASQYKHRNDSWEKIIISKKQTK